jgi:hypoxanthine phosphoribosyltransferase
MDKLFIQADELLRDSFKLAWQVYESGYRPNYIIGVWRGGAPIGIAVQEFLDVLGVPSDHIAIRTSHYKGIDERDSQVQVYGLNYIIKQVESEDSLLIVDDVHDTGISIQKIILDLQTACKKNTPEIKVATPYFKPKKNKQIESLIFIFMKLRNGLSFLMSLKVYLWMKLLSLSLSFLTLLKKLNLLYLKKDLI